MATEKFCLKWNDFESNISGAFKEIRDAKDFFDVTLACDDDQLQAHKVILSACSPFFRAILKRNPHQHPLLYLKGVKYSDLQSVLNFMYHGEVNVAQDELNSFLAVAEELRVKGLTQNNQSSSSSRPAKEERLRASPPPPAKSRASEPSPAPPAKRPRPNPPPVPQSFSAPPEDDDIQEVVPVKSEPRDNSAVSALADSYGGGGVNTNALTPANDHQLATDEDANYDESYEDYGGYGDQSYDASMMDPNMTGDTNKGGIEELALTYLVREVGTRHYTCGLCGKGLRDRTDGKRHLEAKHFRTNGAYSCAHCGKCMNTFNGLKSHKGKCPALQPLGHAPVGYSSLAMDHIVIKNEEMPEMELAAPHHMMDVTPSIEMSSSVYEPNIEIASPSVEKPSFLEPNIEIAETFSA